MLCVQFADTWRLLRLGGLVGLLKRGAGAVASGAGAAVSRTTGVVEHSASYVAHMCALSFAVCQSYSSFVLLIPCLSFGLPDMGLPCSQFHGGGHHAHTSCLAAYCTALAARCVKLCAGSRAVMAKPIASQGSGRQSLTKTSRMAA